MHFSYNLYKKHYEQVQQKKTNILMSRLITLAGVLIIFTALPIPLGLRYTIYIVSFVGMILIPNIYSYLLFQKENEGKKK